MEEPKFESRPFDSRASKYSSNQIKLKIFSEDML